MNIKKIFDTLIEIGIDNDPRGRDFVYNELEELKTEYQNLSDKEKEYFDISCLKNPYPDSRIYNFVSEYDISNIFVGIDIETQELLLCDTLKNRGEKIDLVITHHPEGMGLNGLSDVMNMQTEILHKMGIPINVAEKIISSRQGIVGRGILPVNYSRAIDASRLLKLQFLGVHSPADNCVTSFLDKIFKEKSPRKLKDILDILLDIEEYKISKASNNAPCILSGDKNSSCGKIFVDMTGGTEGPIIAIEELAKSGIGTIVGMHLSENHLKKAKECNMNIVIAGHMASDTLGMNLIFDELENKLGEKFNYIECSGFKRITRK